MDAKVMQQQTVEGIISMYYVTAAVGDHLTVF